MARSFREWLEGFETRRGTSAERAFNYYALEMPFRGLIGFAGGGLIGAIRPFFGQNDLLDRSIAEKSRGAFGGMMRGIGIGLGSLAANTAIGVGGFVYGVGAGFLSATSTGTAAGFLSGVSSALTSGVERGLGMARGAWSALAKPSEEAYFGYTARGPWFGIAAGISTGASFAAGISEAVHQEYFASTEPVALPGSLETTVSSLMGLANDLRY